MAYLATSLLVDPASELSILVTATIQADLKSDNFLVGECQGGGLPARQPARRGGRQPARVGQAGCVGYQPASLPCLARLPPCAVCTALQAVCHIVSPELVNVFLPQVSALLRHDRDLVKKKALLVLQRFVQLDSGVTPDVEKLLVEKIGYKVGWLKGWAEGVGWGHGWGNGTVLGVRNGCTKLKALLPPAHATLAHHCQMATALHAGAERDGGLPVWAARPHPPRPRLLPQPHPLLHQHSQAGGGGQAGAGVRVPQGTRALCAGTWGGGGMGLSAADIGRAVQWD